MFLSSNLLNLFFKLQIQANISNAVLIVIDMFV